MKIIKLRKLLMTVTAAVLILLGLAGCADYGKKPDSEHPTEEKSSTEHPSSEHPK